MDICGRAGGVLAVPSILRHVRILSAYVIMHIIRAPARLCWEGAGEAPAKRDSQLQLAALLVSLD